MKKLIAGIAMPLARRKSDGGPQSMILRIAIRTAIPLLVGTIPIALYMWRNDAVHDDQISALQKSVADFMNYQVMKDYRQDDDRDKIKDKLDGKIDAVNKRIDKLKGE